jgi:acylphosphatase
MKHISIHVTGKVQGVFFRASTKAVADQLGVNGFVRNESDGSVYIEAEADQLILEKFMTWCQQGPQEAIVKTTEVKEGKLKHFKSFDIKRW